MSPQSPTGGLLLLSCAFATIVAVVSLSGAVVASAQIEPDFAAPLVIVDRDEVREGDTVSLTIAGFRSPVVTAALCGNDARRGSPDCDMVGAKSVELNKDGSSTVAEFIASFPADPCPCVFRVANSDNSEVAIATVTLVGHPSSPVVAGASVLREPLHISLTVDRRDVGVFGWARSSLGGATDYDVMLVVENRSVDPVFGLSARTVALRGERVLTEIDVADLPTSLQGGERWEQRIEARLTAPVFGEATWRTELFAETSPTVVGSDLTSHTPGLLILAGMLLVSDLGLLAQRKITRRRASAASRSPRGVVD